MNTILTTKINNVDVIYGFGKAQIDPIRTEKNIKSHGKVITSKNRKELFKQYAIYFDLPVKEKVMTDNQINDLKQKFKSLKDKEVLTDKGSVIPDYRGSKNFIKQNGKWKEEIIEEIGITPSKLTLTENEQVEFFEQKETERISALTTQQKQLEKETVEQDILNQSIYMRMGLEIKGDKDALKKSQDFYNENISLLNEKLK